MALIMTAQGEQVVPAISGEVFLVIDPQYMMQLRPGDRVPDGALLLFGNGAHVRLVALFDPQLGPAPENQVQSWSEPLVQQLLQHYQPLRATDYPAERLHAHATHDFTSAPSTHAAGSAPALAGQFASSSLAPLFVAPTPSPAQHDTPSSSNNMAFAIERTGAHILASAGFDTGHALVGSGHLPDAPMLFAPEILGGMSGSCGWLMPLLMPALLRSP